MSVFSGFSQSDIDYLSFDYSYLDKNFNIRIDSPTFNKAIKEFGYFPDRILNYKDSLGVIMMIEFSDWNIARRATLAVGFTWKRLSYYSWKSEKEMTIYSRSFGITHPYRMFQFLIDENNNNPSIVSFFDNLKLKIKRKDPSVNFSDFSRKELLSLALRINPKRISDQVRVDKIKKKQNLAYRKRHGVIDSSKVGVGCSKKDCCQKSDYLME